MKFTIEGLNLFSLYSIWMIIEIQILDWAFNYSNVVSCLETTAAAIYFIFVMTFRLK